MVLPREVENPVWGWSQPGYVVTVEVKDSSGQSLQRKTARAGTDGRCEAAIGPFKASEKPLSPVFTRAAQPPVTLTASAATPRPQLVPRLRVTDETRQSGPRLVNNPVNSARPSSYSAVGYFFGRQLHRTLKVPIGIVQMSWGGTSIEAWIDRVTLSRDPNFPKAATLTEKVSQKSPPSRPLNSKASSGIRANTTRTAPTSTAPSCPCSSNLGFKPSGNPRRPSS